MLTEESVSGIILPDGTVRQAEDEEKKQHEEGKYTKIFPISYYDFAAANHIKTIGTDTINKWVDTLTNGYQYDCGVDEVKRFFHITGDDHDEDIRLRKYKVTTFVTGNDTEKKTLVLKLILKFQDQSMLLGLVDKLK